MPSIETSIIEEEDQSKLLSVIVIGRNDNYMGNFKYRLTTCLNYLARNLRDLGRLDDVEIMVTDWNSDVPWQECCPSRRKLGESAAQTMRLVCFKASATKAIRAL